MENILDVLFAITAKNNIRMKKFQRLDSYFK